MSKLKRKKPKQKTNGVPRPRKTEHITRERNGQTLTGRFGVITGAMSDLRHHYLDEHCLEFDRLNREADTVRKEQLEKRRAEWSDIDLASGLAHLLGAIETAKNIDELRKSDAYKATHEKAQPLADIMSAKTTQYQLMSTFGTMNRMHFKMGVWVCACLLDLNGDVGKYLGSSESWPILGGNAGRNHIAVQQRVEILSQLEPQDIDELCGMAKHHLNARGSLTEKEAKN